LGLRRATNFIPPLKSLIDRILVLTAGAVAIFTRDYEHKLIMKFKHDSTDEITSSIHEVYGWTPSDQRLFTEELQGMQFGDKYPCYLRQIILCDVDTGGRSFLGA